MISRLEDPGICQLMIQAHVPQMSSNRLSHIHHNRLSHIQRNEHNQAIVVTLVVLCIMISNHLMLHCPSTSRWCAPNVGVWSLFLPRRLPTCPAAPHDQDDAQTRCSG